MSNRQIVLHIGFSKTGSSALQVFLSQNQNLLASYNYGYPEIDPYHFEKAKKGEISSGNAHLLREVLHQDTQNASLNQSARLLTHFLSANGRNSTLIISSESFGVMTEEEIAFFSRLLRQFSLDVKIICYVRRQDQYIEAAWTQWQSKLSDSLQLDLRTNPDVVKSRIDPIRHYVANGWHEGRDPAPGFSTANYLAEHPDIAVLKLNPFVQYILDQKITLSKCSPGEFQRIDPASTNHREKHNR